MLITFGSKSAQKPGHCVSQTALSKFPGVS